MSSNPYIFLLLAIIFGTASNSFAKSAEGFTQWLPSIASAITIILCMYALSNVMKVIPIGITYASFAGLCIIATAAVGIIKYSQTPNFYTVVGLILIIIGVLMVNLLGKMDS
jgi:small multidrug resistance pump|tara:strand:+ start:862 stop:1197 length:336 start_codon:yes stop_codon:yes gene_type:complete